MLDIGPNGKIEDLLLYIEDLEEENENLTEQVRILTERLKEVNFDDND